MNNLVEGADIASEITNKVVLIWLESRPAYFCVQLDCVGNLSDI
jgi:hypothetical protein